MTENDARWLQKFNSYKKVVAQLDKVVARFETLNEIEILGLIQCFEYAYELSRNVLEDLFEHQGYSELLGNRDVYRLAVKEGLISDGETWTEMITSRAKTVHTYNEEIVKELADAVVNKYHPQFRELLKALENPAGKYRKVQGKSNNLF